MTQTSHTKLNIEQTTALLTLGYGDGINLTVIPALNEVAAYWETSTMQSGYVVLKNHFNRYDQTTIEALIDERDVHSGKMECYVLNGEFQSLLPILSPKAFSLGFYQMSRKVFERTVMPKLIALGRHIYKHS